HRHFRKLSGGSNHRNVHISGSPGDDSDSVLTLAETNARHQHAIGTGWQEIETEGSVVTAKGTREQPLPRIDDKPRRRTWLLVARHDGPHHRTGRRGGASLLLGSTGRRRKQNGSAKSEQRAH